MKATDKATVVLDLKMVQAERIWTEFRTDPKNRDIAGIFEAARDAAYRQDKGKAPDPALIPLQVEVTVKQARTILAAFKPYAGFPSDGDVYTLVQKALSESD
jgi:hypothetical protein